MSSFEVEAYGWLKLDADAGGALISFEAFPGESCSRSLGGAEGARGVQAMSSASGPTLRSSVSGASLVRAGPKRPA